VKYLCMPADFRPETLEAYAALNRTASDIRVYETYGNLNPSPFQSGRAIDSPRLPRVSEQGLREYLETGSRAGIHFNYTLNASCSGGKEFGPQGLKALFGIIERLANLGVQCVTLTSPAHICLVHSHWPEIALCTSVICEIDSVAAVKMFEDFGASRIIVSEDIHRRFDIIHAMRRATALPLEVLTNSTCLFRCPWKPFHYNLLSHMSTTRQPDIEAYYHWQCMAVRLREPAELLRLRWIRPEDIDLYEDATYFKVVGRYFASDSDLVRVARTYMERRFDGNLWDLLGNFAPQRRHGVYIDNAALDGFLPWFKASPRHCSDMACRSCDHCKRYAAAAVTGDLAAVRERLGLSELAQRVSMFHERGRQIGAIDENDTARCARAF